MAKPIDILVLPDSHAHPDYNNDRFTWFGKLAHDLKPDTIVNIGDLADMASLCFHSKPKELEGARYKADCDAAIDAQDRIFHELRKHKKKLPRCVWTLGNHDVRPQRYVEQFPVFEGKIKNEDIGYGDYPWEVYPFLESVDIAGVDFVHYATSGLMGRPIGGQHAAWTLIKKRNKSTVVGHSHVTDYKIDLSPGRSLMGLVCGSYIDYQAGYAGVANDMWSRGVAVLRNVQDGLYDLEWISLPRLKAEYGGN